VLGFVADRPVKSVLCVGAHSDDIEIGCGGALLQLARSFPHAHFQWVVLSGSPQRAREARASAAAFMRGCHFTLTCAAFRDGYFPFQGEALKDHFEALKPINPDIIFTHRREDAHQDHRQVAQLTWNTFRNHCILEYEIPKWDGDLRTPNVYVRLDKVIAEKKTRLLMKHFGTQRNKHWFTPDTFLGLLRLRGLECASPSGFAEGFHGNKIAL
jgi:LmbE family N-acetylglucosaminyl deacetylase